jgi:hypothetical protein
LRPAGARSKTTIDTESADPNLDAPEDGASPEPPLTLRRAVLRISLVIAVVAAVLVAGAVNGVGPLARVTPANEVTDPAEILARSMQSVIDASSVHVVMTVKGQVPGALVGRSDATVVLDGTQATLDLRPQDARTHLVLSSPSVGLAVEAITSWDTMAYRFDAGPWTKGSLASVVAGSGIDANPLTLVDRLRKWLASPGALVPTASDVPCDAPSGQCRQVVLSLGREAGDVLLKAFPGGGAANIGATTTDVLLLADATTLQPAHVVLDIRNADGSLAVTLEADFTLWNWPSVIPDPPGG